jgi:hypothetical protein
MRQAQGKHWRVMGCDGNHSYDRTVFHRQGEQERGKVIDTGRELEVKETWQSEPVSENKMIQGRWHPLSPNP